MKTVSLLCFLGDEMMWRGWLNWFRPRPSAVELALLQKIAAGFLLKSHRDLDGQKVYKLWSPAGPEEVVAYSVVQKLLSQKLITTNQKFPAATFLLTSKGKKLLGLSHTAGVSDVVNFDS